MGSLQAYRTESTGRCLVSRLVAVIATSVAISVAQAAPFSALDQYVPFCDGTLPPSQNFQAWSDPATWAGRQIPGIGSQEGANVTIPCEKSILMDMPSVRLTVLFVQGVLKIKDHSSLPFVNLTASFIIVGGRFMVGTHSQQFRRRVEINLIPNPQGRAEYPYVESPPADRNNPRSLGHKAFAVVGGQVDLHGLPGRPSMLAWTKLAATAPIGQSFLIVQGDVSDWPVGSAIVVAPTETRFDEEDVANITKISPLADGTYKISLDRKLQWNHWGDLPGVPDGFGGNIEETAEVALLTRNIVITGLDEPGPHRLEGGHFIVYMTNTAQYIEGVEFRRMGQQGRIGRYNIHMHLTGNQKDKSIIRKNLIIHSKQRCIVIHATDNAVIEGNVAYNTSGHCFMVEDGAETGNSFIGNLGLRTGGVQVKISSNETDDQPATFWISNPDNNFIGNHAGGSTNSGFWLELKTRVRGLSQLLPKFNTTFPFMSPTVGLFKDNVAHSNGNAGFQGYPKGYNPRDVFDQSFGGPTATNASLNGSRNLFVEDFRLWSLLLRPVWVELGNFTLWKNGAMGALFHAMDHVAFTNSSFADNACGVRILEEQTVNLTSLRLVGQSRKKGRPNLACGRSAVGARSPGASGTATMNQTILGMVLTQSRVTDTGRDSIRIRKCTFSGYDPSCFLSAAIGLGLNRQLYWNAGTSVAGVKLDRARPTNPIYLFPKLAAVPGGRIINGGEVTKFFAFRDRDGSLTGSRKGGYIIANNPKILPPSGSHIKCKFLPNGNAYSCPGSCYRTVWIQYIEPGFLPYPNPTDPNARMNISDGPRKLGDYSYLKVRRLADNATFSLEGNLRMYDQGTSNPFDRSFRYFSMSLLGGHTYEVEFVWGTLGTSFMPANMTLEYKDGQGCPQGLTIHLKGPSAGDFVWATNVTDLAGWAPCRGNGQSLNASVIPVQFRCACYTPLKPRGAKKAPAQRRYLELALQYKLASNMRVVVYPVKGTEAAWCAAGVKRCGLLMTASNWAHTSQPQLSRDWTWSPKLYTPPLPPSARGWSQAPGVLGFVKPTDVLRSVLMEPASDKVSTYYFRTSFHLTRSSCFRWLYLDMTLRGGAALYLNGRMFMRVNLEPGPVNSSTPPSRDLNPLEYYQGAWRFVYDSYSRRVHTVQGAVSKRVGLAVREGSNILAVEVHNKVRLALAIRASATYKASCAQKAQHTRAKSNPFKVRHNGLPLLNALLERKKSRRKT